MSRFGKLDRVYEFIEEMLILLDDVLLRILLSFCKFYGNVVLVEIIFSKFFELDVCNSGNYVFLLDVYVGVERWDVVIKFRYLMEENYV